MVLITIVTGANLNQLITGGDHIAVMGGLWHFFTHNRYYLSTRSLAAPRSIQRHREDVDGHGGRPTERCLRGGPRLFKRGTVDFLFRSPMKIQLFLWFSMGSFMGFHFFRHGWSGFTMFQWIGSRENRRETAAFFLTSMLIGFSVDFPILGELRQFQAM